MRRPTVLAVVTRAVAAVALVAAAVAVPVTGAGAVIVSPAAPLLDISVSGVPAVGGHLVGSWALPPGTTLPPGRDLEIDAEFFIACDDAFLTTNCDQIGPSPLTVGADLLGRYVAYAVVAPQLQPFGPPDRVLASGAVGPIYTPPETPSPTVMSSPTISGPAFVGATLTATPGTWSDATLGVVSQWQTCDGVSCTDIDGETGLSLTLTAPMAGEVVRYQEAATATGGVTYATAQSAPVGTPGWSAAPAISGTVAPAATLELTGTFNVPGSSIAGVWYRCSSAVRSSCVQVATGGSYVVGPVDGGSWIAADAVASSAAGTFTAPLDPLGPVAVSLTAQVSGEPYVGVPLVASADATGLGPVTFSYAWELCDGPQLCLPVPSATDATFVPDAFAVGLQVRATVTVSSGYGSASASATTATIAQGAVPVADGVVTITGPPVAGVTLSATPPAFSAVPAVSSLAYRWLRCADAAGSSCAPVAGATSSSYTPTSADFEQWLRVSVVATNAVGSSTPVMSAPTGQVQMSPMGDGGPGLSGPFMAGGMMMLAPQSLMGSGPMMRSYAWNLCPDEAADGVCEPVAGTDASTTSLHLTAAHVLRFAHGSHVEVTETVTNSFGSHVATVRSATLTLPVPSGHVVGAPGPGGQATVVAGGQLIVAAAGFGPSSSGSATLHSDPVALGGFTADASGAVSATFVVPASVPPGAHHVVLDGVDFAGRSVSVSIPVTVVAAAGPDALPYTGSNPTPLVTVGMIMVMSGALAVALGRRRRTA